MHAQKVSNDLDDSTLPAIHRAELRNINKVLWETLFMKTNTTWLMVLVIKPKP